MEPSPSQDSATLPPPPIKLDVASSESGRRATSSSFFSPHSDEWHNKKATSPSSSSKWQPLQLKDDEEKREEQGEDGREENEKGPVSKQGWKIDEDGGSRAIDNDDDVDEEDDGLPLAQKKTQMYLSDGITILRPIQMMLRDAEKQLHPTNSNAVDGQHGSMDRMEKDKALTKAQIKDRLGSLFSENRTTTDLAVSFFLVNVIVGAIQGACTGIQNGAKLGPTSASATALNFLSCLAMVFYAGYLSYVRPQIQITFFIVEVVASWLQACTMICIVILNLLPYQATIQSAMMWIQLSVVAVKIFAIWMILLGFVAKWFSKRAEPEDDDDHETSKEGKDKSKV